MGCFDECLGNMLEPYGGNMPLFGGNTTDATVTIVQESYDDGMKVTRIQTPPRTPTDKVVDAINNVLGFMGDMPMFDSKQKNTNKNDNGEGGEKNDDGIQPEQQPKDKPKLDDRDDDNGSRGFGSKMRSPRVDGKN